jgi:N-acyl homoserine lactone hydrolase
MKRIGIVLASLALIAAAGTGRAQGVDKLYVIDCGWAHAADQSRWSPGVNVGVPIDISDNCYLIHHVQGGYMLWDTGIADAVAAMPEGLSSAGGALVWHRGKTLLAALAEIGVKPADIRTVALSHFHPDHTGNVDEFPTAMVLMQKAEWDYAFGLPQKPFNPDHPTTKLEGDKDVFGDGSVMILSTPGHTPGHESLLVHLPKTGYVILTGDAAHFQSNWENRRVPGFNTDKAMTLASMQHLADVMAERRAEIWINHDKPSSDARRHAPDYYE